MFSCKFKFLDSVDYLGKAASVLISSLTPLVFRTILTTVSWQPSDPVDQKPG